MKSIAIMNLKGGVGKTVTACNVAALLAHQYHKRVLLIDADHQGNSTDFLSGGGRWPMSLRDVLWTDLTAPESVCFHSALEGLLYVPGGMELAALDAELMGKDRSRILPRLRGFVADVSELYDYILVDMPPSFSVAAMAALMAVDEVIIPIKLDAFSLRGTGELMQQIISMRKVNPQLRVGGLLITMYERTEAVLQAEKVLREGPVPVYGQQIRRTAIVDESTFAREPLLLYSPRCAAAVDYRRFVEELMGGER